FNLVKGAPADAAVLGVPVFEGDRGGPGAELDAGFLAERGLEGKRGQTLPVPADDGSTVIAVGLGKAADVDAEALRQAAACLVRAAWKDTHVATTLLAAAPAGVDRGAVAQAIAEGAALAAYRFT